MKLRNIFPDRRCDPDIGRLASSALATAVAVFALRMRGGGECGTVVVRGVDWLIRNANKDGGWGDTPESPSNPAATLLSWSALTVDPNSSDISPSMGIVVDRAERWLRGWTGSGAVISGEAIRDSILKLYGADRTFSVPILTMCAIAGKLGDTAASGWRLVPRLPFELSLLPNGLLSFLGLPVVSYAMPALISMGIAGHKNNPTLWPCLKCLRNLSVKPAMRRLERIQPVNGGFLEAVPLTSFALMSLVSAGMGDSVVSDMCAEYILGQQRPDGSWPIDANLAVWLTTLAVNALPPESLSLERKREIRGWLLSLQFQKRHPFTNAAPGGWGWTPLPGAVPDADDTSGAILALKKLSEPDDGILPAVERGIVWLLEIQNFDGGVPTFCKGWGRLPFDRSCPDITAHAIRAVLAWRGYFEINLNARMEKFIVGAFAYLLRVQSLDGSWNPLWFGSQLTEDRSNPVFGTAKVAVALSTAVGVDIGVGRVEDALNKALKFLRDSLNDDGGWGAKKGVRSTIEETAMAVKALRGSSEFASFAEAGKKWLLERFSEIAEDDDVPAAPIGLYFASLWYSERLYPLIFTVDALSDELVDPLSCKFHSEFVRTIIRRIRLV